MAVNQSILQQKLREKMGNLHDMKDDFISMIEGFITEADIQFNHILSVKDKSFFVESYMNIMKIVDQCLNSFVMLTAFTESLQGNFVQSMKELLCNVNIEYDVNHNPGQKPDLHCLPMKTSHSAVTQDGHSLLVSSRTLPTLPSCTLKSSNTLRSSDTLSQPSQNFTDNEEDYRELSNSLSQLDFENDDQNTSGLDQTYEVYIGNLDFSEIKEDVVELVKEFHPFDVRLKKKNGGKAFAFVSFLKEVNAENCVQAIDNVMHRGRYIKCRQTLPRKSKSEGLSTENDSCYNSLLPDMRGNYSLCYPKIKEPPNCSYMEVQDKFKVFGDFREIHFTKGMIFVRYRSKRATVAAFEKYQHSLDMRIANHGQLSRYVARNATGNENDNERGSGHSTEGFSPESENHGSYQSSYEEPGAAVGMESSWTSLDQDGRSYSRNCMTLPTLGSCQSISSEQNDRASYQTCYEDQVESVGSYSGEKLEEEDREDRTLDSNDNGYDSKTERTSTKQVLKEDTAEDINTSYLQQLKKIWT